MSPSRIGVVVVDDHAVVREGLVAVLRRVPDIEVLGDAPDGASALELLGSVDADVAVIDHRLPDRSGPELCCALAECRLRTRALIMSAFEDDKARQQAFLAGAHRFILKDVDASELIEAIRTTARGCGAPPIWNTGCRDSRLSLTPTEARLLQLLRRGGTLAELAASAGCSRNTAKESLTRAYAKLGVSSRSEAVARVAQANRFGHQETATKIFLLDRLEES